ncbi:A24 family peptidase [Micavibrio aeruginosavorus]|uniref:A24 family peptidase n=1 Tax=Micavibrio aeruginosavorus TaxID=349221 RepID=UPI0022A8D614|nr:prepilin peptidase [Micavibrio aeruginosavorus]
MKLIFAFNLIYCVCFIGVCLAALGAACSDVRTMTIPNVCSVVIMGLFVIGYGALALSGGVVAPWWSYVSSLLIVFVVTLGMFVVGAIGGGDSKFAASCALWVGLKGLVSFLLVMMVVGMVLAVFALVLRNRVVFARVAPDSWVGRVQRGESAIPYGVAITSGLFAGVSAGGGLGPLMAFFY